MFTQKAQKTKKLLVFENKIHHADEDYENYKHSYENCASCHSKVTISSSLSMVWAKKNLQSFFVHN
jgi:hypothetical protein